MTQYEKMTQTPVSGLIMRMSVPTIISMMVTNIYNLADTAFVGQLGNSASGAVGCVFGFMAILQAVGFLFGQGSGNVLSRQLGAQENEEADITASTGFFLSFFIGMAITVICIAGLDPLVHMLGSTDTIAPYAKSYIFYILLAAPFMTASFTMNNLLRYEGLASLGMIGLLVGGILNICGDPFFMFVLDLGIDGAGISTAISQTISFFILLSMYLRHKTQCRISIRSVRVDTDRLSNIVFTGFPSLLRQGLNSLTAIVLNLEAAPYGDEAVAAMSIVSRIAFFVFAIAIGTGQGFQPVSAFNYGARKYTRVRKGAFFTLAYAELLIIIASLVVLIGNEDLIRLFRDDPEVVRIASRALRLVCLAQFVMPLCMITEMLLQSTGKKFLSSLLSSIRSGLFFIPIILILGYVRGLAGVQEAQALAYLLTTIPAGIIIRRFFRDLPKTDGEIKTV